jgi:hypothetical protein
MYHVVHRLFICGKYCVQPVVVSLNGLVLSLSMSLRVDASLKPHTE